MNKFRKGLPKEMTVPKDGLDPKDEEELLSNPVKKRMQQQGARAHTGNMQERWLRMRLEMLAESIQKKC